MLRAFRHPTTGRPRWLRLASGALMMTICVYLILTGLVAYHHVDRLRQRAARMGQFSSADMVQVGPTLHDTLQDMRGLQRSLALPLWLADHAGWVPWAGPTLKAAPVLFDGGVDLIGAADETYAIVEPWLIATLGADAETLALGELMDLLTADHAMLQAQAQVARSAVGQMQAIDAERLLPRAARLLLRAQALLDLAPLGIEALVMAPDLVGSEPRTYLLLAQNNHELRATGGFISAMATLTLSHDLLKLTPFVDSYQVENWAAPHPDPPEPLREYMGIDLWVTRDGNWWPDFPTSARAVGDLYTLNQGVKIDGVIAADLYAAQQLLEALTPLTLASGRQVESGEVDGLFRESWGLPAGSLLTEGLVITATRPYDAVEVSLQYPAVEGQVWFDAVELTLLSARKSNLVQNPSFEQGLLGWQVEGSEMGSMVTTRRAFEGQHSATLIGDAEHAQRIWQRIDIQGEAGSAWHVSAQSAAQGVPVGEVDYAMFVSFVAEDGSVHRQRLSFPVFTHDWATAGSATILGDWWRHRKDIIAEALGAAMTKVKAQPGAIDWESVATSALAMLDQRHVQVAFFEPAPARWIAEHGWDGALRRTPSDFLMVVDSNVGYNKVTASMQQAMDYRVDFAAPNGPLATLTLVYTNTSSVDVVTCDKFTQYVPTYDLLTQGCYWDYVRIYAPKGAALVSTPIAQEPIVQGVEAGYTVLATSLVVPPGETAKLQMVYRLPEMPADYGLYLQKQAGVVSLPAKVTLLSPPSSIMENHGGFSRSVPDALIWQGVLVEDKQLPVSAGAQ